ncbi:phosphatidylinositol N-acetylglucosaminyltransferase subunit P [Halyomorpha halys]|uniref:phosphatidylinositol N-acetylglucosaminyltransferase subunit P n=1 Tax=Halyomorpha halys TaxID=286706 RepID=UPI000D0C778F|nr:phosphatidylinositol N-acetylglucosaminyltransferase subunit P [Halyomorpha halys]
MELDVPASSPSPSPSRANYGFTLYLASTTAFYVFLTWSLIPSSFLPYFYFPQFYWAVAIPIFCLVTLALVGLVLYPALNLCLTPAPEERCVLVDSFTLNEPPLENREVPPMYDIPMTTVSRLLYLD